MHPEGVLQLLLAGMGLLQTAPLMVTLTVEKGFFKASQEIGYMFMSGGPLYFIFHIQTKCYYFQQTLLAGGAKYRPTGRGFVIRHSPFDENYRFFATSHIYLGFEIAIALILFALYTSSKQYVGLTWSLWLTATSFILGPFWFNPVTFEWNKLEEDYTMWMRWMAESGGTAEQSWEVWWKEENSFFKGLSLSWKTFLFVQKSCLWFLIAWGLGGERFVRDHGEQQKVFELIALYGTFFFGSWCIYKLERSVTYAVRRFASLVLTTAVGGMTIYLFASHTLYFKFTVAMYYFLSGASFCCLMGGFQVRPLLLLLLLLLCPPCKTPSTHFPPTIRLALCLCSPWRTRTRCMTTWWATSSSSSSACSRRCRWGTSRRGCSTTTPSLPAWSSRTSSSTRGRARSARPPRTTSTASPSCGRR
jgi:callose synthase